MKRLWFWFPRWFRITALTLTTIVVNDCTVLPRVSQRDRVIVLERAANFCVLARYSLATDTLFTSA